MVELFIIGMGVAGSFGLAVFTVVEWCAAAAETKRGRLAAAWLREREANELRDAYAERRIDAWNRGVKPSSLSAKGRFRC